MHKCCVVLTFSYPLVTAIYPADKRVCQSRSPVHLSPSDALMHKYAGVFVRDEGEGHF